MKSGCKTGLLRRIRRRPAPQSVGQRAGRSEPGPQAWAKRRTPRLFFAHRHPRQFSLVRSLPPLPVLVCGPSRRDASSSRDCAITRHAASVDFSTSIHLVRVALTAQELIGVKLYPPKGFRPYGNAGQPYPRKVDRVGPTISADLNRAPADLYVELDTPILPIVTVSMHDGVEV